MHRKHYPFQLEPFIGQSKLHSHHDKYLQTYVDNLDKTLKPYPQLHYKTLEELIFSLEEIPAEICTSVQNNSGGVYNHQLYFASMGKSNSVENYPQGEIATKIAECFGFHEYVKQNQKKLHCDNSVRDMPGLYMIKVD